MGPATEHERRLLHQKAEAAMGTDAANILMKAFPPYHWPDVVTNDHLDGALGRHTLIILGAMVGFAGVGIAVAQLAAR